MQRFAILLMLSAACSTTADSSTTTTTAPTMSTTTEATTTTTFPSECASPPYRVEVLPETVEPTIVDPENLERNPYLEVPGSSSTMWLDGEGGLAVALIRGTLPLDEWPGDRGEVTIDGARAVAGQMDDGSWVVGWFEEPGERCDLFTMVFFPPVQASDIQATLASMDRTAG